MTVSRTHPRNMVAALTLAFVLTGLFASGSAFAQRTTNQSFPFTMTQFVACANDGEGELVTFEGTLHIMMQTWVDDEGCTHIKSVAHPKKLSGTGSVTGDSYQATGMTMSIEDEIVNCGEECVVQFSIVNNFRLIGQGPGNNYTVHQQIEYTYDFCNQEYLSIEFKNEKIDCK
ncbi:hypothetical protein KQI65_03020 [bacterium]|nr:hypothetical protein [bacterium]